MEKNIPEGQRNSMCKGMVGGDVAGGLGQLGPQSLVLKGTQALEAMKVMKALPVEAEQLIPGVEGGFLCDTPCFLWTLLDRVQPLTLGDLVSDLVPSNHWPWII